MNLKEEIVYNTSIEEMAQQHFDDDVFNLIKAEKFEQAAERYIDLHGTAKLAQKATATTGKLKAGTFAKTLKASPENIKRITDAEWKKFETAYSDLMGTSAEEKRKYVKTKGTVDTATGKIKTSSQSGATRAVSINKLEAKIQKVGAEYQRALEAAKTDEEKEEIKSHLEGLTILGQALQKTKKGEPSLPPETDVGMKKLEDRYKKIETGMGKKMDRPTAKFADEPSADDKQSERAFRKVRQRTFGGFKTIDDIEDEFEHLKMRQEFKKKATASSGLPESMKLKGKMLSESYSYYGNMFWENYIGSNLVRGFNEDVKAYGIDVAAELYVDIFGIETAPIFEYMAENEEALNEAASIEGTFLFESYGVQNVKNYLYEASVLSAGVGGAARTIAKTAGKGGVLGFLGGLWEKFKAFGRPIVKKLGAFAAAGVTWAKNIATKGLAWIHTNPIARIAVPVVALAGTVAGGIYLLNKLRKKAGKPKLTSNEEKELQMTAERKGKELKRLKGKAA